MWGREGKGEGAEELMTTLIDWRTLQTSQGWQVGLEGSRGEEEEDGKGGSVGGGQGEVRRGKGRAIM